MATNSDNISDAINNLTAKIKTVTENPKPSYSIDGHSVSHSEYLSMLIDSLERLEKRQSSINGPFEIRSGAL